MEAARLALADGNEGSGRPIPAPSRASTGLVDLFPKPSQACPSPACRKAAPLTYVGRRPRSTGLGWPRYPAARRRTRNCGRRRGGRWRRCTMRASVAPSACPTTHPCTCRACWATAACAPWSTRYVACRQTWNPRACEGAQLACGGLEVGVCSATWIPQPRAEQQRAATWQCAYYPCCSRANGSPFRASLPFNYEGTLGVAVGA